ncbi:hypothetical protein R1sor_009609 [Riccia sorocarpa]|uniref:Uncharacterized protein n=1 Tax=Riccia sorocarpa TaxID=122646 RepID=A0ABD3HVQ3_9MARC
MDSCAQLSDPLFQDIQLVPTEPDGTITISAQFCALRWKLQQSSVYINERREILDRQATVLLNQSKPGFWHLKAGLKYIVFGTAADSTPPSARKLQESLTLVGQAVSHLLGATRGVDWRNNPIWQSEHKKQNLALQSQEDTLTLQGKKLIYLSDESSNEDESETGTGEEEKARRLYQHFLSEKAQERAAEDRMKLKGIAEESDSRANQEASRS